MKKILLTIICICMLWTPIKAEETIKQESILISIKGAENLYLININDKTMKVKTISTNLYTKISCLDNEYSTLKSVDFTKSYPCLINTLAHCLNTKINHYVSVNMPAILKEIGLKENEYDYQTLDSLTSTAKKILKHFKLSMIIHYDDFIETDLNVNEIYELYQFFHKDKFSTKYYYLNYLVMNQRYYLLDARFHLKK